ncbi:MAG: hypothetical protein WBD46_15000 [Acidobacteriaceae bacterium]
MQESNSPSRFFGISLGHKLIALLLAGGIAWGGYVWLHRRAVLTASAAQLSFDPRAARHLDSGLASVHDPAVALAQSVLTDQEVEQLASSAHLASTSVTGRIGEFRARLQLAQPSSDTLSVRFLGAGGAPSVSMADTVAQALANWTPSLDAAPLSPPVNTAPPPPQTTSAPVKTPPATQPNPSASALDASLGDLEGLLSSTKRDLDGIADSGAGGQHPSDPAAYRESDQQHLLKARVGAAEQKLEQIRSSAKDAPPAAAGQISDMQRSVASILSAGHAAGFAAVGVSAGEIRRERAQLDDAIATVHRDRLAIQKETAASGDGNNLAPASTTPPPATNTAATPPPNPSPTETNLEPTSRDIVPNPFAFTRSAATPAPVPWWPAVVAGLVCGLLYWSIAALANREPAYEEFDAGESTGSIYNFITPSAPPARIELEPAPPPVSQPASWLASPPAPPVEQPIAHHDAPQLRPTYDELPDGRSRRASFRFEPAAPESATPEPSTPEPSSQEPATAEPAAPEPIAREHSAALEPPAPEPPAPRLSEPLLSQQPVSAAPSSTEPQPTGMQTAEPDPPAPQSPAPRIASSQRIYAPDPLFDFFAPDPPRAAEPPAAATGLAPSEPPLHLAAQPVTPPELPASDSAIHESHTDEVHTDDIHLLASRAPGSRTSDTPAPDTSAMPEPFTPRTVTPPPALSIAGAPVEPRPAASLPEALLLAHEPAARQENVVELPDTWVDDIRKALAQTDIGRRFEEVQADGAATGRNADEQTRPARRDRLAG